MPENDFLDFDDLEMDSSHLGNATDEQLREISKYVEELVVLYERKERGEMLMSQISARIAEIEQQLLPRKMRESSTSMYSSLATGQTVELKDIIKANMPKQDTEEGVESYKKAIQWLDKNGLGEIVSRRVVVDFGKESSEMAKRVIDEITRLTNGQFIPIEENAVNFQTLNAALRRRMEAGNTLPSDTGSDGLIVFHGSIATLKGRKKSKKR